MSQADQQEAKRRGVLGRLKGALIAGHCHHVVPAWVVALGFRLFDLRSL